MESITATIIDLVGQFLDMVRNSEIEPPGSGVRQAGLMYELGNFDAESVFTALDLSILEVSVDQPIEAFVVDGIDG
mgnify:CR=1 FL=1